MKVIITDESKKSQMVIHKYLKELFPNLDVKYAFTGEEALQRFDSFKPEVSTIDIVMSGIDGIETSKRIAGKNSSAKIIIVTSTDEKLENFKHIPIIKAVVNKPITLEKIKTAFSMI